MTHLTTAIVFVVSRYLLTDAARCIDYCRSRGYVMAGVVKDDWAAAIALIRAGQASVIVVADTRHLDPDREPRIEVVAEGHTGHDRTRIIRRGEEA